MDGRLPDVDYVNMRMENLLDDDQETLIGSEVSVSGRLRFKECVKQRAKELQMYQASSRLFPSSSGLGPESSPPPDENVVASSESLHLLVQRIQDMRLRCLWMHRSTADNHSRKGGSLSPSPLVGEIEHTTPEHLAYTIHMQQRQLLQDIQKRRAFQTSSHSSRSVSQMAPSPHPDGDAHESTPVCIPGEATSHKALGSVLVKPDLPLSSSRGAELLDESSGYHSSDNRRVDETACNKPHWVLKRHSDGSTYVTRLTSKQHRVRHRSHHPHHGHHLCHNKCGSRGKSESLERSERAVKRNSPSSETDVPAPSSHMVMVPPTILFSPARSGDSSNRTERDRRYQPILTVTTL